MRIKLFGYSMYDKRFGKYSISPKEKQGKIYVV
jgi:hypothetical protein